jgi:hypothetical protein
MSMAEVAATPRSNMRIMLITSMMGTFTILFPQARPSSRNTSSKSIQKTQSVVRPIIIAAATKPVINMDPVADTSRYRTATMWIISSMTICTILTTVTVTIMAQSK